MSDSAPVSAPLTGPHPFEGKQNYALSSDLARLSLPAEYRDAYRTLAWVNSICFLFLLIGIVGLRPPQVHVREINSVQEIVPVVFTPPEETPKPPIETPTDEPPPQDAPVETPQVVMTVAAVESPAIAFAVPVQGATAVTSPRFATPPPPVNQQPTPQAVKFDPNASRDGIFPKPLYPGSAQRNKYEGTVTIEMFVDSAGNVTSAKVQKTSGFNMLDEAALKVVRERWKFLPGGARHFTWDCKFELPK